MKPKVFFAELVGTFTLVFIGAGTMAQSTGVIGTALAFGLTAATIFYLFGDISGAHLNPAITLAVAFNGVIKWVEAVFYWIAQFLGSILAAGLLYFIFGGAGNGLGATVLANGVGPVQGVAVEAVLTFFLVNAVLFAFVKGYAGRRAGFVIGLTLTVAILLGGPLTGASLNPARTLGPAIFTNTLGQYWIYLVGQLIGAGLAALFYRSMVRKNK